MKQQIEKHIIQRYDASGNKLSEISCVSYLIIPDEKMWFKHIKTGKVVKGMISSPSQTELKNYIEIPADPEV